MKLMDRAALCFVISVVIALLLFGASIISYVTMTEYLEDNSTNFPGIQTICGSFVSIFFLIIFILLGSTTGRMLYKASRSTSSLRAMYISIFYPILIISFLLATIKETFMTAFIFGFPVFAIGMFVIPYSAYTMSREARVVVKGNMLLIYCKHCRYAFEMFRSETSQRCPLCGTLNENYLLAGQGTGAKPGLGSG